jgi:hypothetical protein
MLGELVPTTIGKWIIHAPTRCPNGHALGPQQVLVGHQACLGHGGGHTTWTCRLCDATVYGPPLNTHCTTLGHGADIDQKDLRAPSRGHLSRAMGVSAAAPLFSISKVRSEVRAE